MIEVEKKFKITPEQEARLIEGSNQLGETTNHDVYFDLPDLRLSLDCCWLRNRNGRYELKWRAKELQRHNYDGVTMYDEIEDEELIAERLGLDYSGDLSKDLESNDYQKIGEYTVTRKSYKNGLFKIDLDETDFGYHISEIERMIEDETQKDEALEEIEAFARSKDIELIPAHGKLPEYFRLFKPDYYQVLRDAGII